MPRAYPLALCLCGVAVLCLAGQARPALPAAADARPIVVEPVVSPAGPNSSAPQLTVEGDRAILSWIERSGKQSSLKFAERTASGWSGPQVVVSSLP